MHKQKKHWEANKVKLWPEFFWQTPNTTTSSYHSPGYTSPNFLAFFTNLEKNKTASGTFSQKNQSQLPPKGLLCNRVIRTIFRLPQLLLHSIFKNSHSCYHSNKVCCGAWTDSMAADRICATIGLITCYFLPRSSNGGTPAPITVYSDCISITSRQNIPLHILTTQILERACSSAFTLNPPKSESTSSPADFANSTLGSSPTAATIWSVSTCLGIHNYYLNSLNAPANFTLSLLLNLPFGHLSV